jgi:hypothetical protein
MMKTALEAIDAAQKMTVAGIRDLQPQLKPQSLVVTTRLPDELSVFNQDFPFDEINGRETLRVIQLMDDGAGGDDGFRLLLSSTANKLFLEDVA